jgi:hypothetical protein
MEEVKAKEFGLSLNKQLRDLIHGALVTNC